MEEIVITPGELMYICIELDAVNDDNIIGIFHTTSLEAAQKIACKRFLENLDEELGAFVNLEIDLIQRFQEINKLISENKYNEAYNRIMTECVLYKYTIKKVDIIDYESFSTIDNSYFENMIKEIIFK